VGIDISWQAILHNPVLIALHITTKHLVWFYGLCNIARGKDDTAVFLLVPVSTANRKYDLSQHCIVLAITGVLWISLHPSCINVTSFPLSFHIRNDAVMYIIQEIICQMFAIGRLVARAQHSESFLHLRI